LWALKKLQHREAYLHSETDSSSKSLTGTNSAVTEAATETD